MRDFRRGSIPRPLGRDFQSKEILGGFLGHENFVFIVPKIRDRARSAIQGNARTFPAREILANFAVPRALARGYTEKLSLFRYKERQGPFLYKRTLFALYRKSLSDFHVAPSSEFSL